MNWTNALPPSLADFESIANHAWERIAPEFRDLCSDLVVRIEDLAVDEVLDELDIESPYDLMGLYQGISIDRKSVADAPTEPDMVFLYRRAILDYWADSDETLGEIITHVLVHEIGHHFGFSDDDMDAIEDEALET